MIYFIIVFLFILFAIRLEFRDDRNIAYLLYAISVLILVVLAGLRGDVEPDYINYKDIFQLSSYSSPGATGIEPGYFYFNKLIYALGLHFQWVVFIMAAVSIALKANFFKQYSPNCIYSLLLFYCSVYFLYDFIAIRQALALSIFFIAIPQLINRDPIKYFALVILASLFHISALVLLPLYFFLHKDFSAMLLYGVIALCLFLNLSEIKVPLLGILSKIVPIPDATLERINIYSLEQEFASVSYKQFGFAILFVFYRDKLKEFNIVNLLVNLFVVGILLATLFNEIPQFAFRTKAFFLWADVLLLVFIIHHLAKESITLKILLYVLFAVIYTYTMAGFLNAVASRGDYFFPYRVFFDEFLHQILYK